MFNRYTIFIRPIYLPYIKVVYEHVCEVYQSHVFSLDQGNMLERKYEKRRLKTEEKVIKKTFEQDIYLKQKTPITSLCF